MTSLVLSLCVSCRRNNGDRTCTSFPDGIPDDILIRMADHRTSRDGEPPYLPDPDHANLLHMWEVVTGNETDPLTASVGPRPIPSIEPRPIEEIIDHGSTDR